MNKHQINAVADIWEYTKTIPNTISIEDAVFKVADRYNLAQRAIVWDNTLNAYDLKIVYPEWLVTMVRSRLCN